MRRVFVLGFFIIILILIAGCTSSQNATSTGSKSQNPASRDTNVITTYESYMNSIFECNLPPIDPLQFQNFLPNVPRYERKFGQNISQGNNYIVEIKKNPNYAYNNRIIEWYRSSNKPDTTVYISFEDLGPCAGSADVYLNNIQYGTFGTTTKSKMNNFHGYPGTHTIESSNIQGRILVDHVEIFVTNRLTAGISLQSFSSEYTLTEAEAEIEKFAKEIDFKGFAASV